MWIPKLFIPFCIGMNTYPAAVFKGPPEIFKVRLNSMVTKQTAVIINSVYLAGSFFIVLSLSIAKILTHVNLGYYFLMLNGSLLYFESETICTSPRTALSSGHSEQMTFIPVICSKSWSSPASCEPPPVI